MIYAAIALILFAATTAAVLSMGRYWRHRSAHGYDVGALSQRWLSEIRREDEA